jgi:uncharacterized protein YjbJ (UPF0337 family)
MRLSLPTSIAPRTRRHVTCEACPRHEDFLLAPNQEQAMTDNLKNRAVGAAEELGGKLKKTVGKAIGNQQMEAEGHAKELKGEAKQAVAKGGEHVKGKVEELTGAAKKHLGSAIGNQQMQAEGKAKELKGEARQALNTKLP